MKTESVALVLLVVLSMVATVWLVRWIKRDYARRGEKVRKMQEWADGRDTNVGVEFDTPFPLAGMNALAMVIREINQDNGWNVLQPAEWSDTYKVPAILALVHSEVSEALEAFRKDDRENFAEEIADSVIRLLDCSAGLDIDIDGAVWAKLAKNRTRGYRHGGKRV